MLNVNLKPHLLNQGMAATAETDIRHHFRLVKLGTESLEPIEGKSRPMGPEGPNVIVHRAD